MSSKPSNAVHKSTCEKLRSSLKSATSNKSKIKLPKKVVVSRKWHQNCCHEPKSQSAGIIASKTIKSKKTTRSESTVSGNAKNLDFCKKCGDTDFDIETAAFEYAKFITNKTSKTDMKSDEEKPKTSYDIVEKQKMIQHYNNDKFKDYTKISQLTSKTKKITITTEDASDKNLKEEEEEPVEEYYRNEKFQYLYDSMHDIDNGLRHVNTLNTITEVNEKLSNSEKSSKVSVLVVESSDEETSSVKQLKDFRDKNYFECHSAKTRIDPKINLVSGKKHKCSYRFYLNDRLFPVPVNRDYNDNIRCVDCHLPLDLSNKEVQANGTIQAKVRLGSDTQDSMLILPVKEPLIIKQKKKHTEKIDSEVVYYGVIKLDQNGNSLFCRSLPSDSLALKYQKGYREFYNTPSYRYNKMEEGDVIVI